MLINTLPDIVDIIFPSENHLKFIEIVAKHRVNVICLKPLTNSLTEAKNAIKTAKTMVSR